MTSRLSRRVAGLLVFAFAFVVNPLYFGGCVSAEEDPNFGEVEMLALLDTGLSDGPWRFTAGGIEYELSLTLTQSVEMARVTPHDVPFMQNAFACGERSFYQNASACVSVTRLPVNGTFALHRIDGTESTLVAGSVPVEGALVVYGDDIRSGDINLEFRDAQDRITVHSADATTFEVTYFHATDLGTDEVDIAFPY